MTNSIAGDILCDICQVYSKNSVWAIMFMIKQSPNTDQMLWKRWVSSDKKQNQNEKTNLGNT